ncbi:MAG: FecR domain-containing protein [Anaerolineaceae bacterium]|nr:FecR domain-containing protein [Anaerolineaceae bacterium]
MTYLDNLLEECLNELDRGIPLEKIVQHVPSEAAEILPLLRLAAVTRELPHPSMASTKARAQRGRIMKFARSNAQPERRFSWRFAMAQLSMVAALVVVALLTIGFTGPRGSRYATLSDVQGIVEVFDGQDWRMAANGERVHAGEKVRTRIDSQAALLFYEGSHSQLGGDTEVTLEKARGGWNRSLDVDVYQAKGLSTHTVAPLQGKNSHFVVGTGLGQAAVRGTIFDVEVIHGTSRFSVHRGTVEVTYGQERTLLTAGQVIVVEEGGAATQPAYAFDVQGPIEAMVGDQWTVGNLSFFVDPALVAGGNWNLDDWVRVRGRILADGSLVADWIQLVSGDKVMAHFSGLVESIGAESWVVGGKTVMIDSNTEIEAGLAIGDPVEVGFVVVESGDWLALEIVSIKEKSVESIPGTVTGTNTRTPQATFTSTTVPSQTQSPVPPTGTQPPGAQLTPTAVPVAGCAVGEDQPEIITLAERYGVTPAEILYWFCQGYGFGEIDLAYELAQGAGVPVSTVFEMVESGMGWGLIKQTLQPATATPEPTSTLKPTDEPKPTKEPEPTDEPKPTKEPKPTDEPKPTKDK